ncbi:MAG: TOBE-like domain-containing protein, partial [Pirellula sp.]
DIQTTGSEQAKVYVRPHELQITRDSLGQSSICAQVQRIHRAGASAKVFVQTSKDQNVRVDVPMNQFQLLELGIGQQVFITPLQAHVFSADYEI